MVANSTYIAYQNNSNSWTFDKAALTMKCCKDLLAFFMEATWINKRACPFDVALCGGLVALSCGKATEVWKNQPNKIWNQTTTSDLCTRPGLHIIVAMTSNLKLVLANSYLKNSLTYSSQPPQGDVATTAGVVVAAIVVILLCIGVTVIVCLKRRRQHARKFELTRYVASYSLWTPAWAELWSIRNQYRRKSLIHTSVIWTFTYLNPIDNDIHRILLYIKWKCIQIVIFHWSILSHE